MDSYSGGSARGRIVWAPQPGPQTLLLQCPVADILFGGARGGGKSDALLGDWVAHASRSKGWARGVIFRRSTPELEEVISRSKQIFQPLGAVWRSGVKTWTFPCGSTLKMRWLDRDEDADLYQGHQYSWIGADELGTWKSPDPIDKLRATLRNAHGVPCVMRSTANPGGAGHSWIKARYVDPAPPLTPFYDNERKTWRVFIPSKLTDNRVLIDADPTYMDRLRASGPPWLVKAWLEGDWDASAPRGGIFLPELVPIVDAPPPWLATVRGWDLAATEAGLGKDPDWTVGVKLGRDQEGRFYLLDVVRLRGTADKVEAAIVATAQRDGYATTISLPQDPGQAGKSQVLYLTRKLTGFRVHTSLESGDKMTRAMPTASQWNVGNISLIRAGWNEALIHEASDFDGEHGHDDQIDALSRAFSFLTMTRGPLSISAEVLASI